MARKTIAKTAKPRVTARLSAAGRSLGRLAKAGVAALALSQGLHAAPVEAARGFNPASNPFALQLEKLENHAQAVATNYKTTHVKPDDALHLVQPQSHYENMGPLRGYSAATADLARVMAVYPDWLAGEHFARNFRFVQKPEVIKQIDPQSKDPSEFNAHGFMFLKRAAFVGKGKNGISPYPEHGGRDASKELRAFYHDVDSEHIKTTAGILKEAFEEYAKNDVYWDALFVKYSITPTSIMDFMVARHLKKTKGGEFWKGASVSKKDEEILRTLVFRGTRNGNMFTTTDGKTYKVGPWIDAYRTSLGNATKPSVVVSDARDIAVSKRFIGPESPETRYPRLLFYHQALNDWFLDDKGEWKIKGMVTNQDLRETAKAKVWALGYSIAELKKQRESETDQKRAQAVGTLIADYESRIKDLTKKYIEGKESSSLYALSSRRRK